MLRFAVRSIHSPDRTQVIGYAFKDDSGRIVVVLDHLPIDGVMTIDTVGEVDTNEALRALLEKKVRPPNDPTPVVENDK